jgi:hypothetical protein
MAKRIPWKVVLTTLWTVAKVLVLRRNPQAGQLVGAVDALIPKDPRP